MTPFYSTLTTTTLDAALLPAVPEDITRTAYLVPLTKPGNLIDGLWHTSIISQSTYTLAVVEPVVVVPVVPPVAVRSLLISIIKARAYFWFFQLSSISPSTLDVPFKSVGAFGTGALVCSE